MSKSETPTPDQLARDPKLVEYAAIPIDEFNTILSRAKEADAVRAENVALRMAASNAALALGRAARDLSAAADIIRPDERGLYVLAQCDCARFAAIELTEVLTRPIAGMTMVDGACPMCQGPREHQNEPCRSMTAPHPFHNMEPE